MQKLSVILLGIAGLFLTFAASCSFDAEESSYAEDRALIEDLQARYLFALDFGDADAYAATFTEDGELFYGPPETIRGRDALRDLVGRMPDRQQAGESEDEQKLHPATGRHNISNIVIKINGDKAEGRAYWFHYSNNNPERKAVFDGYGHYEDEMVKVNGEWLFSKRKIYNEQVADWASKSNNPAW
jgi:ketosteroid isomerase-like protein